MTALIVIAVILLLLYIPVRIEISYLNKSFGLRVKYLIFTLFSVPSKKRKRPVRKKISKPSSREKKPGPKKKKPADKAESKKISEGPEENLSDEITESDISEEESVTDDISEDKPEKSRVSSLMDEIRERKRQILLIWGLIGKNLKKICKDIHIDGVTVDITAASEDAYSTAMLYGGLSAAVWNILGFVMTYVRTKLKRVDIKADFTSEKPEYAAAAKIKLTPAVFIGNVLAAVFKVLININKIKTPEKSIKTERKI